MMKVRGVTSIIIQCLDCDWNTADRINGIKRAEKHNRKTGHALSGDKTVAIHWNRGDKK
jgi:hypothetical protein